MEEEAIIEERQELMVPTVNGGVSTLTNAHFLGPTLCPTHQPLPKPPSAFLPSKTNITKMITKREHFWGTLRPLKKWKDWVDSLLLTHQETWKKAGIFDAIRASTYHIRRDNELIIGLAEKWCSQTNSFILPWGECSITLEDVMVLGGFSVDGACVRRACRSKEIEGIQKTLVKALREIKRDYRLSHATQAKWLDSFKGRGGELEHVALIVLWLSRYVLTTNSCSIVTPKVFPFAITLARGTRIALAPHILASIYRDLSLLRKKIVITACKGYDDGSKLALWTPFQLVQVWAWERFPNLGLEPIALADGEPRIARWHDVDKSENWSLRRDIESAGDEFLWRPYALVLKNWEIPKFYHDQEMWISINPEVDEELLPFARCLRISELVGMDCLEQYLPHRVGMQFGLDQDIPTSIPRLNDDYRFAWRIYDKPPHGLKIYLPHRLFEGDVTVRYSNWWKTGLSFHDKRLIDLVVCRRQKSKLAKILHSSKEGNGREAPFCSSAPCNVPMGSDIAGTSQEMAIDESPTCKGVQCQTAVDVTNEIGLVSDMMLEKETDSYDHDPTEDKEKAVKESNVNKNNSSQTLDDTQSQNKSTEANETLSREPRMGPEISSGCSIALGELGKEAGQDEDTTSEILRGCNKGKGKEVSVHQCSPCIDTIGLDFAECSKKVTNARSPTCESIPSQGPLNIASEVVDIGVMNPLMGLEAGKRNCEHNATEADNSNKVTVSNMNMYEGTKYSEGIHSRNEASSDQDNVALIGERTVVHPAMNRCPAVVENEHGKAADQDTDANQVNNLLDDPVVISDEEQNDDHKSLDARRLAIDAWMRRLEGMVTAKLQSRGLA